MRIVLLTTPTGPLPWNEDAERCGKLAASASGAMVAPCLIGHGYAAVGWAESALKIKLDTVALLCHTTGSVKLTTLER